MQVTICLNPIVPYRDIVVYALGDEGPYDSFEETDEGLKAYVPKKDFNEAWLRKTLDENLENCKCSYTFELMPDKDWNAEWESHHEAVLIGGGLGEVCYVRAPFHPVREDVTYDIVINPKMAFGTAHHPTTGLMLSQLMDMGETVKGKVVLDMGCGTAVLSILAAKMGASYVDAVDVDECAWRNAEENVATNGCENIVTCRLGDATTLTTQPTYDIVLANINKNILLKDMSSYVSAMKEDGILLLSGFFEADIPDLETRATELGLEKVTDSVMEEWAQIYLMK
ncbi:MAG: 50S ribosomal protein L11 methyltransferase [Bacteroidales bacterium]|nr:50S ribosomal protein L11 methyltransferase [Bacteroidales bacterium]